MNKFNFDEMKLYELFFLSKQEVALKIILLREKKADLTCLRGEIFWHGTEFIIKARSRMKSPNKLQRQNQPHWKQFTQFAFSIKKIVQNYFPYRLDDVSWAMMLLLNEPFNGYKIIYFQMEINSSLSAKYWFVRNLKFL